eukprot:6204750-Pleurochrysis_carterae.AAC.1
MGNAPAVLYARCSEHASSWAHAVCCARCNTDTLVGLCGVACGRCSVHTLNCAHAVPCTHVARACSLHALACVCACVAHALRSTLHASHRGEAQRGWCGEEMTRD